MYQAGAKGWLKHGDFILIDLICLQVAFILSYVIRHGFFNPYEMQSYRNMAIFLEFADIVVFFFFEPFKNVIKRGYYKEFVSIVKQIILIELFAMAYLFVSHGGGSYSRISLASMGIIYVILGYLIRCFWKAFLRKRMLRLEHRSLLIVTTQNLAADVVQQIRKNNYEHFRIVGLAITDIPLYKSQNTINGVPVVADGMTVANYVCREWVDEVFVIFAHNWEYHQKFLASLAETGVTMHINLDMTRDIPGKRQLLEKIGNYSVITTTLNYAGCRQIFAKRLMDIAGGLVGCLCTAIIFLFVAPIIHIQSPGPVFFSQIRIGKNGKKFKMYKFRSMYLDAEARKAELMDQNRCKDGMMFKVDFDTRIIGNEIRPDGTRKTGIGQLIRSLSLDEFPQFFNVLKGDMSLVGTRPPTLDEWNKYELHHRARLAIKPGITGMWQVSGRSNIMDFEEVVRLDTEYITNWSIGLDIKLLFKTVAAVLKREGSL